MTLAEFVLARIAEDEEAARAAAPGPWDYGSVASVAGGGLYDPTVLIASLHYEQPGKVDPRIRRTVLSEEADRTGVHIARWDPARVLAECEAKRRIVEMHEDCDDGGHGWDFLPGGGCGTLAFLALPYADHPGYRRVAAGVSELPRVRIDRLGHCSMHARYFAYCPECDEATDAQ